MKVININLQEQMQMLSYDAVASIGFFDGLHKMHLKALKKAKHLAKKLHQDFIVVTFDQKIRDYLVGKNTSIFDNTERLKMLQAAVEPDLIYQIIVDDSVVKRTSTFFMQYLQEILHVTHIVVGDNFRFGVNAAGTPHDLQTFFGKKNVKTLKVQHNYSTTKIKQALGNGDIKAAKKISKCL